MGQVVSDLEEVTMEIPLLPVLIVLFNLFTY